MSDPNLSTTVQSPVWNPYLKKDIELFESVQKKFASIFIRCKLTRRPKRFQNGI